MTQDATKYDEILRTAARLFAANGYHATSMRILAEAVNLHPATLYHHFSSKGDLLAIIMDRAMDDALGILEEIVPQDIPPGQKAHNLLASYARYFAGDRDRLELLVNEMRNLSPAVRRRLESKERRFVGLFRDLLDQLAEAGLMRPVNHSVAVFSFFGMVHYTLSWYRIDGPIKLEELTDQICQIFLGGVLDPAPGPEPS